MRIGEHHPIPQAKLIINKKSANTLGANRFIFPCLSFSQIISFGESECSKTTFFPHFAISKDSERNLKFRFEIVIGKTLDIIECVDSTRWVCEDG